MTQQTTIKFDGADVEIDFSAANEFRAGIASHAANEGPNDGDIILVNDQPFRIAESSLEGKNWCRAEMYELDPQELADWKTTDAGQNWQAGR